MLDARFAHIFFFVTKEKTKKRKPTLWGRGCAVKVFGKNTTRFFSTQWSVAVGSGVFLKILKKAAGNEGGDFFQNRRLDLDSALAAGLGSPLTLPPFYLFSEIYLIFIF